MPRYDRERKRNRTPTESIIAGTAFTLLFGVLLVTQGGWWWIFPMVMAGVFPLVEGVRKLFSRRRELKTDSFQREADTEKQILRAAQEHRGRLTATTAALSSSLTIKEAQSILEQMAKNGYAVMNVTKEGLLEFEFPEFLPQLGR